MNSSRVESFRATKLLEQYLKNFSENKIPLSENNIQWCIRRVLNCWVQFLMTTHPPLPKKTLLYTCSHRGWCFFLHCFGRNSVHSNLCGCIDTYWSILHRVVRFSTENIACWRTTEPKMSFTSEDDCLTKIWIFVRTQSANSRCILWSSGFRSWVSSVNTIL